MSTKEAHIFPVWLNQEYIQDCIQHRLRETIEITEFKCVPATVTGENYASAMVRISVEYETKLLPKSQKASYILKTSIQQLPNTDPNAALEPYDVYRKEMFLYDTIFPQFKNILDSSGYTDSLIADCIKIDDSRDVILLEDLRDRNFVIGERTVGLNFEHVRLVLSKLARFHASSAVLNEQQSGVLNGFDRGTFTKHTNSFAPFYTSYIETCGEVVSTWPGFEEYGAKLCALKDKIMNYGRMIYEPQKDNFNMFCHGDLWTNNVMFQYGESDKVTDAILIDFQFACWTSPTIDLHHFFRTSLTEDIQEDDLEQLVQLYHSELVDNLRCMGFKGNIPTLQRFWVEYVKTSFMAVIAACVIRPFMLNENTKDGEPFALLGDDERSKEYRRKVYSNDRVQRVLKKLLPVFNRRGLLDRVD